MKKRRNIKDCKFWKPRGRKTHYCSIDSNDPLKQCYGVCKHYSVRIPVEDSAGSDTNNKNLTSC